jgi:hypothetical protein
MWTLALFLSVAILDPSQAIPYLELGLVSSRGPTVYIFNPNEQIDVVFLYRSMGICKPEIWMCFFGFHNVDRAIVYAKYIYLS